MLIFTACKRGKDDENYFYDISNKTALDNASDKSDEPKANNTEEASEQTIIGTDNYSAESSDTGKSESETSKANYYVTGDGVRLRKEGSTSSDIIYLLNHGTEVEYIDREGDWIKVKYNDATGYIRYDLLNDKKPDVSSDNDLSADNDPDYNDESTGNQSDYNNISNENRPAGKVNDPKIIIKKSQRILELWDDDSLYATYAIGLGWDPVGDKQREGDGRTPEGKYYVCTRNSNSRFYLSLGVSYPNKEDAKEALDAGLIDQATYEQIAKAIERKTAPPWNTPLGGAIMIHGHGSQSDWTAGCVAVDNDVMDILWENCPLGTPIIIEP